MDQTKITLLHDTIIKYKQMEHSQLWDDIDAVLKCGQNQAASLAESHCNSVSFWGMANVEKMITISYPDFFKFCLNTKTSVDGEKLPLIKPNGYFNAGKDTILSLLGYKDFTITKYRDFSILQHLEKLNPNKFYQLAVTGHFMSSYILNNQLYIDDTMHRGMDVLAHGAYKVDAEHFIWLMEM